MHVAGKGSVGAYGDSQSIRNLLGSFWSVIHMNAPTMDDNFEILSHLYPTVPPIILATSLAILSICQIFGGHSNFRGDGHEIFPGWKVALQNAQKACGLREGELSHLFGRYFSLQDMCKLCERLTVSTSPFLLQRIHIILSEFACLHALESMI